MFQQRQARIQSCAYSIKECLQSLSTPIDEIVQGYLETEAFQEVKASVIYNNPIAPVHQPSIGNFMRLRVYCQNNKPSTENQKLWNLFVTCDLTEHIDLFESFHTYLKKTIGNNEIKEWFSQNTKPIQSSPKQTSNKKVVKEKQQKATTKDDQASSSSSKAKKTRIPATVKRLVWNKHIGEETGKSKCLCCKVTDITQMSFNCGHIVSENNGGDVKVDNLLPVCQNCNSSMGTMNMDEFKEKHGI
jgi:hypothetical protein